MAARLASYTTILDDINARFVDPVPSAPDRDADRLQRVHHTACCGRLRLLDVPPFGVMIASGPIGATPGRASKAMIGLINC
jgi:hypothetical protein